jgi:predicted AAA+ superfamily ATPase
MLYRKITSYIEDYLKSDTDKILVMEGARQVGKSFSIREVGKRLFPNYVEINFVVDDEGEQLFKKIHRKEDFYLTLSMVAGQKLSDRTNTLIFLDEIQHYPQYLTMLKFLREDGRYRYIASGSQLGITLQDTTSIPVGSIIRKEMFQLDFEEFLIANGFGIEAIAMLRQSYETRQSLTLERHNYVLDLFRRFGQPCDHLAESRSSFEFVRKAMEYIKEHIGEKLTVSDIAANAGFSKFYFLRRFRESTGMTVVEYVNTLRCERAKEMLNSGQRDAANMVLLGTSLSTLTIPIMCLLI